MHDRGIDIASHKREGTKTGYVIEAQVEQEQEESPAVNAVAQVDTSKVAERQTFHFAEG